MTIAQEIDQVAADMLQCRPCTALWDKLSREYLLLNIKAQTHVSKPKRKRYVRK